MIKATSSDVLSLQGRYDWEQYINPKFISEIHYTADHRIAGVVTFVTMASGHGYYVQMTSEELVEIIDGA